jgi:hypothetical protein
MYTKERGFHFGAYEDNYGIRDGQFMREYHRNIVRTNYKWRKPLFGSTPVPIVQELTPGYGRLIG